MILLSSSLLKEGLDEEPFKGEGFTELGPMGNSNPNDAAICCCN